MCERDSDLNKALNDACENPDEFDFGFVEEREETGYANFGFDPANAEELRDAETARIAKEEDEARTELFLDDDDNDYGV